MKKYNLKIGIPFSILVSVVAVLLRLIKLETADWDRYLILFYYYFCFSLLCWIGNNFLVNNTALRKLNFHRSAFFFAAILSGCVVAFLFDWINTLIDGKVLMISYLDENKRMLLILFRGALLNSLISFMVFHFHHMKENEQNKLELEHLKQANLQANISSLKEQLSPHFLFNTFNTLTSLSHEQPVKDYIDELSNVYRYLLSHQKKNWVTLKEDLDFCGSYLYIIKTRLEDAIEITIKVDEAALTGKIPPLTLQLLIENAIKHNIAATYRPLKIDIYTTADHLVVANNHRPKNVVEQSSGIGLNNISQRYRLLFDRDISIENERELFKVALPLIV